MQQEIAETWDKLESVLSAKANPLLRKPSRAISPAIVKNWRPVGRSSDWTQRRKKSRSTSISQSHNGSFVQEFSYGEGPASRRYTPLTRPATAPLRSSRRRIKAALPFLVEGLTEVDLQLIYKAKCDDSGLVELPEQRKRFYEFCERNIRSRKFELQKCSLGPAAAAIIAQLLRNNYCFGQLELGTNLLGDRGAAILAKTLSKSINLVHLGLCNNDISPEGTATVLRALANNQSLTSLDVSSSEGQHRNRLAVVGCEAMAQLLSRNHVLAHLNIAGTGVGPDGLQHITEKFRGNTTLLTLNLGNNGLVGKCIEDFIRAVVGSKLRVLSLAGNKLGAAGSECVALLLQGEYRGYCPLLSLDLSKSDINHQGAAKLYSALSRNSTLKHLSLEGNPLGPQSNSELMLFFLDNRALSTLNLSSCGLRAEGVAPIGEGLTRNHSLTSLNLAKNAIEDQGAIAIAVGLGRNDTLKSIDLSSNRIRDAGGNALFECLKSNRVLEAMNLQDNNIHDTTEQLQANITRYNRAIQRIELRFNPINPKSMQEIRQSVTANRVRVLRNQEPVLHSEISRLQVRKDEFKELEIKCERGNAEKEKLLREKDELDERFERFRVDEERKFEAVQAKLGEVLQVKAEAGLQYCQLEAELVVRPRQDEKVEGEKVMREWQTRVGQASAEAHRASKERED